MQNELILERIENLRGRKPYEEKKAAKLGFASLYEYFEDKIAKEAKKYGAIVPFLRPQELAKDDSTDYELYEHFSSWLKSNNHSYESIVQVRPTTPARDIEVLKDCIKFATAEDSRATGFRSVFEMSETAWKTFELNKDYISPLIRHLNLKSNSANLPRTTPKIIGARGKPNFFIK